MHCAALAANPAPLYCMGCADTIVSTVAPTNVSGVSSSNSNSNQTVDFSRIKNRVDTLLTTNTDYLVSRDRRLAHCHQFISKYSTAQGAPREHPRAWLPHDIIAYLVSLDSTGKTVVHTTECPAVLSTQCDCPTQAAYSTVESTLGKLQGALRDFLGTHQPYDFASTSGNPCISPAVSTFMSNLKSEHLKGAVKIAQSRPLLASEFHHLLAAATKAIQNYITDPSADVVVTSNLLTYRAALALKYFAGDRIPALAVIRKSHFRETNEQSGHIISIPVTKSKQPKLIFLPKVPKSGIAYVNPVPYIIVMQQYFVTHVEPLLVSPSQHLFITVSRASTSNCQQDKVMKLPQTILTSWCLQAGVPRITWHSFRSGRAVEGFLQGNTLQQVCQDVGWSDTGHMAKHYATPALVALNSTSSLDTARLYTTDIVNTLYQSN